MQDSADLKKRKANHVRPLLLLAAFTLLLHIPFLNQPVQGDEVTYLEMAREVFRQPLTPQNFQFVFQGRVVDMAGHPHPSLIAYIAALPWMLAGDFSVPFSHAFYLLFALGISFAAYSLAARFTEHALWAGLLVAASPLVQVNTNTVASPEPPALAFLLTGAAAFLWRRFWICAIALSLAGLTALQALVLPPTLLLDYALRRERPPRAAWMALAAPFVSFAAWQGLQWGLTQRLPGAVLLGYVREIHSGGAGLKLANALALLQHLGVLVTLVPMARRRVLGCLGAGLAASLLVRSYPWWERGLMMLFVAFGVNAVLWLWGERRKHPFLAYWAILYFLFAAAAFFAGAARYLLPLVAPMVLLFVLGCRRRGPLWAALAVNVVLGLNISFAAYEFSRVYAEVPPPPGRSFLVNGEWGFRYYMLRHGGRMIETNSIAAPGEWLVSSELSLGGNYDSPAEEAAVPLHTLDLRVRTPLRIIDRYAHTGFSSAGSGLLCFSFSNRPLDRIAYSRTSPFLNAQVDWTPTVLSNRLVYLPAPGAEIRLPLDPGAEQLRFALFARGRGQAAFKLRSPSGEAIFEKTAQVDGELWEPHALPLAGHGEIMLSVDAPPDMRAGWGELTPLSPEGAAPAQSATARLSNLKMGDVRSRPQLVSGWYTIEDGAWRWMAKQAEAVLGTPAGPGQRLEAQFYFPDGHMERAGGPVTVSVTINGKPFAEETYAKPGGYVFSKAVPATLLDSPETRVAIRLNRAMPPTGLERRELGAVVERLGFVGQAK